MAPFAPHLGEALLLAAGEEDGADLAGAWPERLKLPAAGAVSG